MVGATHQNWKKIASDNAAKLNQAQAILNTYKGKSEEITPARISEEQANLVSETVKKAYEVLKMKGYSRSEFIFQGDEPFMLEMNATPGLTEESILPQQAKAAGISLAELFASAIEDALAENE